MDEDDKTPGAVTPSPAAPATLEGVGLASPASRELVPTPAAKPPAVSPPPKARTARWTFKRVAFLVALVAIVGGGGYYGWLQSRPQLPLGHRLRQRPDRGRRDRHRHQIRRPHRRNARRRGRHGARRSQVLARMDTRDSRLRSTKSQAQVEQAPAGARGGAAPMSCSRQTQVTLAQQEFDRTSKLVARGFATHELLDQRRQALNGATAALDGRAASASAKPSARIDAATHDVELYKVNIADNTLVAPRDGRIQYRIANVGEVLPAGGARVHDARHRLCLYGHLSADRGRRQGEDRHRMRASCSTPARRLDPGARSPSSPRRRNSRRRPSRPKDERDKLMFRVRVRDRPRAAAGARATSVRSGLPGVAYVKTDRDVAWPDKLQGNAPR